MSNAIEKKLVEMNITLPASVMPAANYVPYAITGNLVFISGQLPMKDGAPQDIGKVGREFTVEQAQGTAKLCGVNILSHLKAACGGDLSRVKKCVRLGVFVNSTETFTDQPKVANGVSDMMVAIFGEAGKHSRFAVGVSQLPLGVAVEVDATFEMTSFS
ncbi:MAG: RidA family protein [Pseudomonadota bacterium]|nr:RidA family protein [Pseudomonadota bacterium]MDE3037446.1 RidA family protein [Pseudomonadota bacterium]